MWLGVKKRQAINYFFCKKKKEKKKEKKKKEVYLRGNGFGEFFFLTAHGVSLLLKLNYLSLQFLTSCKTARKSNKKAIYFKSGVESHCR